MKKLFFSFVMLVTLLIVAGSAKAQDKMNPYQGGTYTYNLPIGLNSVGIASVTFSNAGMTISGATTPSNFGSIAASTTTLSFNVKYALGVPVGKQTIYLTLTAADGCSNNIFLDVTVLAAPSITLAVAGSGDVCPAVGTPTGSNVSAASSAPGNNTFTYIVTPTISPATGRTYDFNFNIVPNTSALTSFAVVHSTTGTESGSATATGDYATGFSIAGSTATTHVFTVTFTTKEGVPNTTYTATASNVKLHVTAGAGSYDGSNASGAVIVKEIPTIGTFN